MPPCLDIVEPDTDRCQIPMIRVIVNSTQTCPWPVSAVPRRSQLQRVLSTSELIWMNGWLHCITDYYKENIQIEQKDIYTIGLGPSNESPTQLASGSMIGPRYRPRSRSYITTNLRKNTFHLGIQWFCGSQQRRTIA